MEKYVKLEGILTVSKKQKENTETVSGKILRDFNP